MKILDRYVIAELIGPLVTGAATFTLLFMSMDHLFRVAQMIVNGVAVGKALEYLVVSLPSILVLTFPMAVLLACLLAFGRLSSDSEIVAIKAGGVSFLRISLPGIFLTLLISLCSFLLNEKVVPDSNFKARNMLMADLAKDPAIVDQMTLRDVFPDGSERRIFARKLDTQLGVMYDMTLQNFNNGYRLREVYAKRVAWENNQWIMYDVHSYDFNPQQAVQMETQSKSALLTVEKNPMQLAQGERLPEEMSRQDLKEKISIIESSEVGARDAQYNRFVVMYHEKLAIPFTCFVFGLLGMPLGVRPQRTSPSIGLGISLVFILFYYVLMTLSHALGENNVLPAGFAAWLPNVVFGCVGSYLVIRAGRS